jgi:hypothetical protein
MHRFGQPPLPEAIENLAMRMIRKARNYCYRPLLIDEATGKLTHHQAKRRLLWRIPLCNYANMW